jgi:hypothetical protein
MPRQREVSEIETPVRMRRTRKDSLPGFSRQT